MRISLTCNRSSKLHVANFFISDAFDANGWIVLWPKVGTIQNLQIWSALQGRVYSTGYLWFNSMTRFPLGAAAYNIQMRCVKMAFHMPNSNSCIKSTTNIMYGLKPRWLSFSANAFWNYWSGTVDRLSQFTTHFLSTSKPRCFLGFVAQTQLDKATRISEKGETQVCVVGVGV